MINNVLKASSNISYSRKDSLQCSLCKNPSGKTIVYVCNSGHVICGNCQNVDIKQDCGDNVENRAERKNISTSKIKSPDLNLASGDHFEPAECVNHEHENKSLKSLRNVDVIENNKLDKHMLFQNKKTTVVFKNLNYKHTMSSSDSSLSHDRDNVLQKSKVTSRPIICPVAKCSKMVATDSLSLHFYFDHSKIPRLKLNYTNSQEINLKATNFTTETQCIGILLIKKEGLINQSCQDDIARTEVTQDSRNEILLLLMIARISTETITSKSTTSAKFTRNSSTQTESSQIINSTARNTLHNPKCKDANYNSSAVQEHDFKNDDIFILWLCTFEDNNTIYSISLCREDKKLSYLYSGEACHVRNKQDSLSVFHRHEGLQIKGAAVSKCLNKKKQVQVSVKIVN